MKLTRRQVILVKAEPTYKAEVTPTGADAILVNAGSSLDVAAEEIKRNNLRDTMSPMGHLVASQVVNLKISTELRGGGVASTDILPPEYAELLLACAMKETGDATTGWKYAPVSDPAKMGSCTIWWYQDGILHKAIGCMGTWSINTTVNQIGTIEFDMVGLYAPPEDQTMPTPTVLDLYPPICAGIQLKLGTFTPVLSSFQLALGNQVSQRKDLNASAGLVGVTVQDREPSGSIDPEVDALANFDPWSAWSAGTKVEITAQLGTAKGNTIKISVPKAQYGAPKYQDRDGIMSYQMAFTPTIVDSGDDELQLEYV